MDATIQAGEERLRPIVMTSLAFIFGVLPLAIATGAGANARHSIGTGIMGGMIGETTLAMLYVPLFFYLFDTLSERTARKKAAAANADKGPGIGDPAPLPPGTQREVTEMHRILILFVIILCVAGCMVGPDYKRPDIDAPQSFRYEPRQAAETANTQWWKQFNDPVLDQLIAEALANNRNVKIAAANVEQAAGHPHDHPFGPFSAGEYTGSALRQRVSRNTPIPEPDKNPFTNLQVFAGASWEIDLWGRIRRLSEAAQANLLATDEARRGSYPFPRCRGCVFLCSAARPRRAAGDFETDPQDLRRFCKAFRAAAQVRPGFEDDGGAGAIAVRNCGGVRSHRSRPRSCRQRTPSRFCSAATRAPSRGARSLATFQVPAVPAGLPSQLLERRPDILQAEQNLIAANAQIGAAKALYFPSISLTGAFGKSSADTGKPFRGPSNTWNYGGSIIGPIFTAGTIAGQVATATASQKAALSSYVQTIQNAFADVENALVSRQKLGEQFLAEQRRVAAYREYTRLAWLKYQRRLYVLSRSALLRRRSFFRRS